MSKINIIIIMLVIIAIICGSITYKKWNYTTPLDKITILSGPVGGNYYQEALKLKSKLKDHFLVTVVPTNGSLDNLMRLTADQGDIALYQNLGRPGTNFDLIAVLYPEIVYVVSSKKISSLWQVPANARVFVGAENSGTQVRAMEILQQYRIVEQVQRISDIKYSGLKGAFLRGELDVAFLVLGGQNTIMTDLLSTKVVHLLDIDLREGLSRITPANHVDVIPANIFTSGQPAHDVFTISNNATIIARKSLPNDVVAMLITTFQKLDLMKEKQTQEEKYDFPHHPVLLDLQQDRWPTTLHWEKLYRTKAWFVATVLFSLATILLFTFRQSVKESMDQIFFINGYRSRLREVQEQFQTDPDPMKILEDAQSLSDEITRDVQSGIVDKTVQLSFIHNEILQLMAKLIKRGAIDLPKIKITENNLE
ncbi:TAXI family TRAP transporter solute-binding subunit [candidate division CSSED10-310 bacterium]|uniref:TAXI family TRAP transporter solute-binding subunit n=1 Tax=candidate division CSSED10-310 bacterium TaxID=2855610 RepID=A0ABV6YZK7_UNCC1